MDCRDLEKPVIASFHKCWPKYSNLGKCFYNTFFPFYKSKDNLCLHHYFWCEINSIAIPPVNVFGYYVNGYHNKAKSGTHPLHINHYILKSKKEYETKKMKGDVFYKKNPHDDAYFAFYDQKCLVIDHSIERFAHFIADKKDNKKKIEN